MNPWCFKMVKNTPNIQYSNFACCICISWLCTACGSSSDSGADPMQPVDMQVESDIAALFGTWESSCFDNAGAIEQSVWTFSADTVITQGLSFEPSDTACESSVDDVIITYSVTYLPDRQETSLGAAVKFDLEPVAVTASGVDLVVDGIIPADVVNEFRIAQVSDNWLLGGDLSTGDGLSSETRPTQLDSEFFLTRQ